MLNFEIISLEGNLSMHELLVGPVEIAFNILHSTGLEYFWKDFIVHRLELNATCNSPREEASAVDRNICIIPLNVRIETNVPVPELSIDDKLVIKVCLVNRSNSKRKVGQCSSSIFSSNQKSTLEYLRIFGDEDAALLNWKRELFNLPHNSIRNLLVSTIEKKCEALLLSGNALYLKVRLYQYCPNSNLSGQKSIEGALSAARPFFIGEPPFIKEPSFIEELFDENSFADQFRDNSIINQLPMNSALKQSSDAMFKSNWENFLLTAMNFAMGNCNSSAQACFAEFLCNLNDAFVQKYSAILCAGILYSNSAYIEAIVQLGLKNQPFSLFLHWFLHSNLNLTNENRKILMEKISINYQFKLKKISASNLAENQISFVSEVQIIFEKMHKSKCNRSERETLLKIVFEKKLKKLFPMMHPFNSHIICSGMDANSISIFKSTQMPVKWDFVCRESGQPSGIIFKYGDDLRQDEFCTTFIRFINDLWLENSLNLDIVTYKILPVGDCVGFIEPVNACSLATILSTGENSILKYLHKLATGNRETFETVRDRFLRSTAGYAALTFLLGVGDRHLDNLMIDWQGRFFHVDYAYIFGSDPKPVPPAFKLTAEMIDALDGVQSGEYSTFMSLFCGALEIIRKNFDFVLLFVQTFQHSELGNFFETPLKLRQYLENRLQARESIQTATAHWVKIIKASCNALFPQLLDTFHKWAQDWRD